MTSLFLLQAFITIVLLVGSFYVILSKRYDKDTKGWATATIAALVAFWLR